MKKKSFSYSQIVWLQFKKNRFAYYSLFFITFMIFIAIFAPFIANNKPLIMKYHGKFYFPLLKSYPELKIEDYKEFCQKNNIFAIFPPVPYSPTEYNLEESLQPPSVKHLCGTDDRGRDVLARLIHGSRISLSVGFVAMGISVIIGIIIGSIAGYYGGWIDILLSRFIEIIDCFPSIILILAVLAFLPPSIYNIMIVIGLFSWTGIARLVRGEFLKIKVQDYVTAAKALGLSDFRIIFLHILPNALAPVLVSTTFGIAGAILLESALSFLGFGVPPPYASWGVVLSQARDYVDFAWWLTLFPGLLIFLTVLAYNLAGEGLRDAIDPRLRG